jgi:hypothetical protein
LSNLLTVDDARFALETIDEETIILDTARGHLIGVRGGGSFLLEFIQAGVLRDELLREIDERYGGQAQKEARAFIEELTKLGIVLESKSTATIGDHASCDLSARDFSWPASLAPTSIDRYEDIAEIMAIDPIHDVDITGWPRKTPS